MIHLFSKKVRIMSSYSCSVFLLLFFVFSITLQQTLPPKAVNPERIQLLKDALSWMTFRKNGQLASDQDLGPFFGVLKDRYLKSKYYRTMIIAFTRGVLPKLTLKENEFCDHAYTLEYRDSHNNSVTDGQLKKFILESYDKRGEASRQFCDYREGLVCNPQTNKCECPFGSKMESVSQGSAVKRCLVQENQVCSLIDLDNDLSSSYGALKKHLPEMVFNLEKPLSCKLGTQCRFKSTDKSIPLCYGVNNGPWDTGNWDVGFGEECTLGLYGDTGQCVLRSWNWTESLGVCNGYTCFNYGPRSRPRSPHVGICAHELGSYAITSSSGWDVNKGDNWELQMVAFVSPATTPLRGRRLFNYYKEHLRKLEGPLANWNLNSAMAPWEGYSCNIAKTKKMLDLWKFFKRLEETPEGNDYVATEADLEAKFKEAVDLTVDREKKICRTFTELFRNSEIYPALRCVRNSTATVGNDGRCEKIPENEDVTYEWAKYFLQYRNNVSRIEYAQYYEERDFRKDIYEPELECDPNLGPPPGSEGAAPSSDSDVLEGGYCPPDRGCYEDYADYLEIYDDDCQLKDAKPRLYRNCQDLDVKREHGKCERGQLNKIYRAELEAITSYSGLNRGDACKYDVEEQVRNWITTNEESRWTDGNRYKWLIDIHKFNSEIGGKGLCDWKKLLKCSENNICECLPDAKPREVNLEAGMTIFSDYCYLTSGECSRYDIQNLIFEKSSEVEKDEINRHYKAREGEGGGMWYSTCQGSNWCVFTVETDYRQECTTENTGTTGHNGSEPVTTTTTTARTTTRRERTTTDRDESNLGCEGDKCGWQWAGEARKEFHVILKMLILIKIIITMIA